MKALLDRFDAQAEPLAETAGEVEAIDVEQEAIALIRRLKAEGQALRPIAEAVTATGMKLRIREWRRCLSGPAEERSGRLQPHVRFGCLL